MSRDAGPRTAEQREAARLERERRRAAREGRELTPSAVPVSVPTARAPAPPQPAQAPALPQQTEDAEHQQRIEPPEPAHSAEPLPQAELPEQDELVGHDELAQPSGLEPALPPESPLDPEEAPAGTRRVSGLEHEPTIRRAPRARSIRSPRVISRAGRVLSLLAIVLVLALIWFAYALFQPFHGSGSGSVRVVIAQRSTSGQVGDLLAHDNVISSSFFFQLRATLAGERGSLRSGTYNLRHDMSYGDVLAILTKAPPAARVSELTITEGRTRAQLDRLLRSQGIRGSYLAATRRSPLLDPARYGAPRGLSSLEGFLFPSTYQLRAPIRISDLVADQLRAFAREFAKVDLRAARRQGFTPYQVLIIASIIQGEARTAGDQPKISSVIRNRLRLHMRLQMDDTVRFATGNYEHPITVSQLASPSPWNTYTHPRLPPTPIASPGLAALQAAAHPTQSSYLFFVVKPCGNGSHAFASTYAQFLALQAGYNTARAHRGGRSPEFCR